MFKYNVFNNNRAEKMETKTKTPRRFEPPAFWLIAEHPPPGHAKADENFEIINYQYILMMNL